MSVLLLCRTCHNTTNFSARAEIDVDLVLGPAGIQMANYQPELTRDSIITCNDCAASGKDSSFEFAEMISPSLSLLVKPGGSRAGRFVVRSYGYRVSTEASTRIGIPHHLYYAPGQLGAVDKGTASNLQESLVDWTTTVIRDTDLPLLENSKGSDSDFSIRLLGFDEPELAMIHERCKAEGIGGFPSP